MRTMVDTVSQKRAFYAILRNLNFIPKPLRSYWHESDRCDFSSCCFCVRSLKYRLKMTKKKGKNQLEATVNGSEKDVA